MVFCDDHYHVVEMHMKISGVGYLLRRVGTSFREDSGNPWQVVAHNWEGNI